MAMKVRQENQCEQTECDLEDKKLKDLEQCQLYQNKMRGEIVKCYDLWYQMQQKGQEERDPILFDDQLQEVDRFGFEGGQILWRKKDDMQTEKVRES